MLTDLVFYIENYGGERKIPASLFPLWEKRAAAELLRITGGKIKGRKTECVRFCVCEVAEFLYENKKTSNISSENNDGYSVTYQERDIKKEILKIAETYLGETDLLYRGVDNEE